MNLTKRLPATTLVGDDYTPSCDHFEFCYFIAMKGDEGHLYLHDALMTFLEGYNPRMEKLGFELSAIPVQDISRMESNGINVLCMRDGKMEFPTPVISDGTPLVRVCVLAEILTTLCAWVGKGYKSSPVPLVMGTMEKLVELEIDVEKMGLGTLQYDSTVIDGVSFIVVDYNSVWDTSDQIVIDLAAKDIYARADTKALLEDLYISSFGLCQEQYPLEAKEEAV